MNFTPLELIRKKRDGQKLTRSEIDYFIFEYTKDNIPDYQVAAFLMAVFFQGMDFRETADLMQAMKCSGQELDLSGTRGRVIDKHSTGGVGDKVSLVLGPLVAACGICVPMISGRGLGHTGGTLDKLETIPGFRTALSVREFERQLGKIGIAMIGQTGEIAPADRKLYRLRDVTATVDSIPLIAASIMSKKLAEDLDGLVLDVKFGNGAFMKDYREAKRLAQTMVAIGKRSGVKTIAVLTGMDAPLGSAVGNSLEVIESIEALKGNGPDDLMEVTFALARAMLRIANIRGGEKLLKNKIQTGEALEKFKAMVEYQGGNPRVIQSYSRLRVSKRRLRVLALKSGYVHSIDTFRVGMLLVKLGGGRLKKEDNIDPACGFRFNKKTGDHVKKGDCLVEIFSDDRSKARKIARDMKNVFVIKRNLPRRRKLVRETVR
jgi:pyrimidine-nucleoside phosphorylase